MLIFINKFYGITWSPVDEANMVYILTKQYTKHLSTEMEFSYVLEIGWDYRHQSLHHVLYGAEDQTPGHPAC